MMRRCRRESPTSPPAGKVVVEIRKVMDREDFGEAFTPSKDIAMGKIR